jgi:hypothetical protein
LVIGDWTIGVGVTDRQSLLTHRQSLMINVALADSDKIPNLVDTDHGRRPARPVCCRIRFAG